MGWGHAVGERGRRAFMLLTLSAAVRLSACLRSSLRERVAFREEQSHRLRFATRSRRGCW